MYPAKGVLHFFKVVHFESGFASLFLQKGEQVVEGALVVALICEALESNSGVTEDDRCLACGVIRVFGEVVEGAHIEVVVQGPIT